MAIATVNLKFGVNLDSFRSGLSKIEKEMGKLGTKFQSLGSKLSLGVTLPIVALGTASLKAASDAEETFSKFDTVFRDVSKSANEAFESLRSEYGLSSRSAKQLLGDTGDLLTGFGFSQEAALQLSTEVQKLAVDLASFTNYAGGAEGASDALTKALLGERESVKALGIAILEEDVKKQMAINTTKGLIFETERQAKAQATLDLAIQQSTNAIGDYARTSGSFANQSRLLKARLEDISQELGKVFLPLATKITTKIGEAVNWFSKLDDQVKRNIVVFAGVAAAIGPVLMGLGTLMKTIPLITAGFAAMTGPVGLAVTAITIGIGVVLANLDEFKFKLKTTLLEIIDFSQKSIKVIDTLTGVFPGFKATTTAALLALQVHGQSVAQSIKDDLGNTTKNALETTVDSIKAMGDEAMKSYNAMTILASAHAPKINRTTDNGIQSSGNSKPELNLPIVEGIQGITDRLKEATPEWYLAAQEMTNTFNAIINDGIMNGLASFGAGIGDLISGTASIKDVGNMLLGTLGGVMEQLGKVAISTGVAVEAIKTALTSLGGLGAIAAGVALIALSRVVTSRVSKIGSSGGGGSLGMGQSVPGRAMGGTIQAGVPYMVGERGPELMVPSGHGMIRNAGQTANMGREMVIRVIGELVGQGSTLKGIIDYETRVQGRTT